MIRLSIIKWFPYLPVASLLLVVVGAAGEETKTWLKLAASPSSESPTGRASNHGMSMGKKHTRRVAEASYACSTGMMFDILDRDDCRQV
jgi:hypothetical protein